MLPYALVVMVSDHMVAANVGGMWCLGIRRSTAFETVAALVDGLTLDN